MRDDPKQPKPAFEEDVGVGMNGEGGLNVVQPEDLEARLEKVRQERRDEGFTE